MDDCWLGRPAGVGSYVGGQLQRAWAANHPPRKQVHPGGKLREADNLV